jgi:tetratricopeptide (TPR) repeat protein
MERDQVELARQFAHDLAQLHQNAGKPSYSTLEKASDHRLKRATISDILNGNRVRVPDWRFVQEFVKACWKIAGQTGLDPNKLGSLDGWKLRWDAATGASFGAPIPEPASPPAEPPQETPGRPSIWGGVPPRMNDFSGREDLLDDLRRALVRENRTSAVAIQGLCGIGKTQLAVEYAYRHAAEYDLVWWIPCDDIESAHAAMAELESRLGLANAPRTPRENRYVEIFELLRLGQAFPQWLMIFDNANEPATISDLVPPQKNGHILITSRDNRWEAKEDMLELDVFTREESVDFLRRRMRGLSEADAHQLAEAVGDLPLVLEHAAESRMPVPEYLARLDSDPLGLLAGQPSDYPVSIADAWSEMIDQLRSSADYALNLLHCLSFFDSGSIPRELLEKGRNDRDISIHDLLRDRMQCTRAISMLGRVGLLRVHSATGTLQIHRLTQCVVRDKVAKDLTDEAARRKHDVHLLLVAADPGDPEDPAYWRLYEDLYADIGQSDVAGCQVESVRLLIINLVRYLRASGDPRAAVNLAARALERWAAAGSAENPGASPGYLELQVAQVDALLSAGSYQAAFQAQQDALSVVQSDPGRWPDELVALGRVSGVSLRIAGKFEEALGADSESMEQHVARFGQDHPQTFMAINNLIINYALAGNYTDATREAERVYSDCLASYGYADHPSALYQRHLLARCYRLAGRYNKALHMAQDVHDGYASMERRGLLNQDHPRLLEHEIDFAAARQDMGLSEDALSGLAAHLHHVYVQCWRSLGVDHPQTLACAIARGSVLRRIPGRAIEAGKVVAEAEQRYRSTLADHPYTYACAAFLAGIRRQAGSPVRAVSDLEDAVARLRDLAGENHPLTLDAAVALMNARADAGEPEVALIGGRETLAGFIGSLGQDHPHTLACAANVVAVLAALDQEQEAAELQAETYGLYVEALGAEHFHVRLFTAGRRFDLDFTPLPL